MNNIKRSILEAIGNTPLVELRKLRPSGGARILAKMETLNPGGSIKSRPAYAMIREAEKEGLLKPDSVIVEATSGNQGISLCMVGAALGYRVRVVMPANMSEERQLLMCAYGAELVLTDPGENIAQALDNALEAVREMQEADPRVFVPGQFTNPVNPRTHRETTGAEIIRQVGPDTKVDAFVSGIGTGGTITGVGGLLKETFPDCLVVAAEPDNAAILSGGNMGHHVQQGIGDGLIPDVLDTELIDRVIVVSDEDAVSTACFLAREEGLLVGISSGTNAWAARQLAGELGEDRIVVTVLPDTGERYLSMQIFDASSARVR